MVIDAIEEQIMAGLLRVGDPLPPERELAARLQVSRAGVREAVRVLESDGILRSQRGAGPEAGTFVSALPRQGLTRLLRLHVALANFPMTDVVDARVLLERSSAERAASNASTAARAEMRAALARMDAPEVSREAFNDADTDFHIAIAEAGGNELVASLTAAIRGALRIPIQQAVRAVEHWDGLADRLRQDHRGILDAIEAGDGPTAARLTEEHIRRSATDLPAGFGGVPEPT